MTSAIAASNSTKNDSGPLWSSGDPQTHQFADNSRTLTGYRPADWVWVELSLIPEVEKVFVSREDDVYRVVTIVDKNDEELRDRIYDRELALIDSLPTYQFDFHILPRMGRDLRELVDCSIKAAYSRR